MLRLNSTQIRLDKRDFDWHAKRHVERQAQRAAAPPSDITKETKRTTTREHRKLGFPDWSPPPGLPHSSTVKDPMQGPETEIFCDDPVPVGNRAYFDRLLAQAGHPTRLQVAPTASGTIVDPSDEFLDSTHSARASIEQASILTEDDPHDEQSPFSNGSSETSSALDSSNSSDHPVTVAARSEQRPPSEDVMQSALAGHRQSWNPFRRDPHKTSEGPHGVRALLDHVAHRLSGSMAVDGPSDRHSSRDDASSRSTSGGMGSDLNDGLYGSRQDRRTFSGAASHEDRVAYSPEPSSYVLPERPAQPPPRAIGHSRNVSATMPRSSLYISETVASNSPERRPTTPRDHMTAAPGNQGLLSLPPRRPISYRRRTQTYSYAESEHSANPIVPQMDGASPVRALINRLPSVLVSHPPNYPATSPGRRLASQRVSISPDRVPSNPFLPSSSPPELPTNWGQSIHASPESPYSNQSRASQHGAPEIRSYHSNSSIYSSHSHFPSQRSPFNSSPDVYSSNQPRVSRRNLSPYALPFIPRNSQRNGSPQLVLPPPFSSTSRHVSISSTYPPASPASPHTPPQQQPSDGLSPLAAQPSLPASQEQDRMSATAALLHRRIAVYDDRLSPSTQPQTPAGLPRNGVPAMATQNPFNTAPIGGARRTTAVEHWQAFATPTRMPSGRARNNRASVRQNANQENEERMVGQLGGVRRERRDTSWDLPPGEREWGTPTP